MHLIRLVVACTLLLVPPLALAQVAGPPAPPLAGPAPAPQPAPPPLPQPQAVKYFVERQGQPFGPLTLAQLGDEIRKGGVESHTLVWKSGEPTWVAAKDMAELQPLLGAVPPPLMPEQQWQKYLVGSWQTTISMGPGVTQMMALQLRPGGTFSGSVTVRVPGSPPIPQPIAGTWSVQVIAPDQCTLSLMVQSLGGSLPSMTLRRVDGNTLVNEDQGYRMQRVGG